MNKNKHPSDNNVLGMMSASFWAVDNQYRPPMMSDLYYCDNNNENDDDGNIDDDGDQKMTNVDANAVNLDSKTMTNKTKQSKTNQKQQQSSTNSSVTSSGGGGGDSVSTLTILRRFLPLYNNPAVLN